MRPPHFVDCVEVSPGVWASPDEAEQIRAKAPAIADLNGHARRMTPADIPSAGIALEFWIILAGLLLFAWLRGGA